MMELASVIGLVIGWLVSGVAVWLALKLFPGRQKRESFGGALLTALVGAVIFGVFAMLKIPFGTVIAIVVWLYALKKIQNVGWLGAAVLAVLIYIINAILGLFLPTIL
ncbi:MAG: hypothetical protein QW394_04125 [Thermofilaceae archaeon]